MGTPPESATSSSITVDPRFCGPPGSANGGYVSGRLAACLDGTAEVTLRRPPPLGEAMTVRRCEDGSVALLAGDALLGEARPASVHVSIATGAVPDIAAAAQAAGRTFAAALHRIPGCFVCGPSRAQGDGLCLRPGPLSGAADGWEKTLATTWQPAEDLADASGRVRPEFVWAALDCPTAYACSSSAGMPPILLGRQTVRIDALPRVGETCIVIAERQGRDGRKYFADAALHAANGRRLACCRATWIEVTEAQLRAST